MVHPDQLVALPMSIPSGDLSVAAANETTIEADTPTAGNSLGGGAPIIQERYGFESDKIYEQRRPMLFEWESVSRQSRSQ
jgi:hypothetical protein